MDGLLLGAYGYTLAIFSGFPVRNEFVTYFNLMSAIVIAIPPGECPARAGLLVAFLEAAAFAFRFWRGRWKASLSVFYAMRALVLASGLSGRLAFDASAMNRPEIWKAGLALFAANPLGVGLGNSGEIASAFVLPDGVRVRTLVNAHLTLLCELGVFAGAPCLAPFSKARRTLGSPARNFPRSSRSDPRKIWRSFRKWRA